jgi:2-keto-4-pentenoate hydratase/2-oxohepta-3-ene-1,7-dioic acid hydratase in catechol pathway
LKLNGQLKQHSQFTQFSFLFVNSIDWTQNAPTGSTQNMIHKIPELIAYCSGIMTLEEGDLLLTGQSMSLIFLRFWSMKELKKAQIANHIKRDKPF